MSTKGIIFSAPMVRALLDGRKKLAKHIAKHGPVRVLIEAEIIAEWVGMRTPGMRRYDGWSYCFKGDEQ